ncbi:DUF2680 domain-containing protein [Peptococcaceae bacterium 1198_IL3148]
MFKIRRKVVAIALSLTLAISTAGVAMADVTADQLQAIRDWHQQRVAQKAEVLQTHVDAGRITAEQKQAVLDRMEQNFATREAAGFEGCRMIQRDGNIQPPRQGMGIGQGRGCCGGMKGAGAGFGQENNP